MNAVRQRIKNKKQSTIISILFTLLFIFSFAAKAEWSTDITNNTPVCTLPDNQWLQDTKSDGNGGVWMTYLYENVDLSNLDLVMVQHYNSSGTPAFQTNGIVVSLTANWHKVVILGCSTNYIDLCYGGYFSSGDYERRIYSKRVDLSGNTLWSNTVFEPFIESYAICSAPVSEGYIIATAREYDETYYTNDIFAQKVLFDGTIVWGPTGKFVAAMADTTSMQNLRHGFDIIAVDETNVFIVWDGSYNWDVLRVQAQGISSDGQLWWPKKMFMGSISADTYDEYKMSAQLAYSNNILIAWWEYTSGSSSNITMQVQLIGRDGIKKYPENGLTIVDVPYFNSWKFFVETYKNNSKAVFFYNYSTNMYCQSLDITSKTISDFPTGKIVNTENTPQILSPVVTYSDKEVFLPWKQNGEIIYQLFDGNLELLNEPSKISLGTGSIDLNKSIHLNENQIVVSWDDRRNGNWDVFAQAINTEIPEPFLFSIISLFVILLICKKRKKVLIILLCFITSISFAKYGALFEPGNGWADDNERKGRHWNPSGGNEDDFCVQAYYNQGLRVQGGYTNYPGPGTCYYLGIYNNIYNTYMEIGNSYIEFGKSADTINFNNMRMINVRTPATNHHNHAVNVEYVREYMDDSIGGLGDVKTRLSAAENSIIYISNNYVTATGFGNSTNKLRNSININISEIQNNKNEIISVSNYLYYVLSPRTTNNAEKIADNLHFTDLNEQAIDDLETNLDNNYYEKGETDNVITNAISATRNEDNYWKGKTYFANEVTLSNSAANSPQLWLCAANGSKTKLEQKSDNFDLKSWLVSTNNAQIFTAIGPGGEHGEIELYPQKVRVTVPLNMEGNKISGLPISPFAINESDAVCVGLLDEKLDEFGGNVDDRLDDIEIDVLGCQTNIVSLWSNVNEFSQLQLIS